MTQLVISTIYPPQLSFFQLGRLYMSFSHVNPHIKTQTSHFPSHFLTSLSLSLPIFSHLSLHSHEIFTSISPFPWLSQHQFSSSHPPCFSASHLLSSFKSRLCNVFTTTYYPIYMRLFWPLHTLIKRM